MKRCWLCAIVAWAAPLDDTVRCEWATPIPNGGGAEELAIRQRPPI
jgi:hypothetical protein